jgi:hypothetical protein
LGVELEFDEALNELTAVDQRQAPVRSLWTKADVTAADKGECMLSTSETEYFDPRAHGDINTQTIVDLRRMLTRAGYGAEAADGRTESRER